MHVQRIVGLAAIGKVMVEASIAYGDGRNGKSTFWNTIARVLGTYAGNMSADVLTDGGNRNVKPELAEARANGSSSPQSPRKACAYPPPRSSNSPPPTRSTRRRNTRHRSRSPPSHTLILYTNHLPRVGAMDCGHLAHELIVIPFNAVIE